MKRILLLIPLVALCAHLLLGGDRESGGPPAPPPEEDVRDASPAPGAASEEDSPGKPRAVVETTAPAAPAAGLELWDLTPVDVGPGPLILIERLARGEVSGFCEYGVAGGVDGTEVFVFLRHPWKVEVVGRFDRTRLLVADSRARTLHVLDIAVAAQTPFPLDRRATIVEVELGEAYVLDRGRLLAFSADAPERPRSLFNVPVREVFCTTADHLFVATSGEAPEIWRVPKRSGATLKVSEAPDERYAYATRWATSPSGRLLAAGLSHFAVLGYDQDAGELTSTGGGPRIVIVDTVAGAERVLAQDLDIGVSVISSGFPMLELTWVDENTIRFSETEPSPDPEEFEGGFFRWVDIDVRTGERIAERRYSKLGIRHEKPPRDLGGFDGGTWHWRNRVVGLFRREDDKVFFRGEEEPAAVSVGPIEFSPDGRFAALLTGSKEEPVLTILNGKSRTLRRLTGGAGPGFRWLAAAR